MKPPAEYLRLAATTHVLVCADQVFADARTLCRACAGERYYTPSLRKVL